MVISGRLRLLILQLIATPCFGKIAYDGTPPADSFSKLIQSMTKVLRSCHVGQTNVIGIAGTSSEFLISALAADTRLSVVSIDQNYRSLKEEPFGQKLNLFVITTSSHHEFKVTLARIKHSRWWNHLGIFYIIYRSPCNYSCSLAIEFLWITWSMNLLKTYFMCTDKTRGRMIFTFNPYTKDAPHPWKLEEIHAGENGHPWTLFARPYSEDPAICQHLEFDKTRKLGGYEIRMTIKNFRSIYINSSRTGLDSLSGEIGEALQYIFRTLNATPKFLSRHTDHRLGSVDAMGRAFGTYAEIASAASDVTLNERILKYFPNISWTYPHYQTTLAIVTQYRGHESQLSKILSLIDQSSQAGFCIVCCITLIFAKYFFHETPAAAMLTTFRIFTNRCLVKIPVDTSSRIYMACLFCFLITIYGIYQGELSSLLAKRILLRNVGSLRELAESDHTIYSHKDFQKLLDDKRFANRSIGLEYWNCTEFIWRDPSAACLAMVYDVAPDAARMNLSMSLEPVNKIYWTWLMRESWPLEERFKLMVQRFTECFIFDYAYSRNLQKSMRIIKGNDDEDRGSKFKVLSLKDLSFAFVIVGIGLSLSVIIFIVEAVIGWKVKITRVKPTKTRKHTQFPLTRFYYAQGGLRSQEIV